MTKQRDHLLAATADLVLEQELPMVLDRVGYLGLASRYGLSRGEARRIINYLVDAGKAEFRPCQDVGFKALAVFPKDTPEAENRP